MVKKVKQLSLFLDNKPGVLAKVCAVLAKHKVNILGISVTDGHDHAVVRLVTDDSRRAVHALGSSGILVVDNEVLMVDLPNRAGALGAMSRTLASARINIEYSYATASTSQKSAAIVLSVNDTDAAEKVLNRLLISKKT